METGRETWTAADGQGSGDMARRITNELYQYVCADEVDVPTVLDMYDWVRESNFNREDSVDLPTLARRWTQHERDGRDADWLMRAFGE